MVAVGLIATIDGIAVSWAAFACSACAPDCVSALPPGRIDPEKAAFRDSCNDLYLETFTDEIENSTMNSAISSVIMSA